MLLLAAVSLIAIPAMVGASGARPWGMIAAGQAIGAVAAVIVGFGWGLSGPAIIAKSAPGERRREYVESALARMVLFVPAALAAFAAAWIVGGDFAIYAGFGALSSASVGLTANWYFVGTDSPYMLLICETLPRVLGTLAGIAFMLLGSSALVGVVWQLVGMLAAFLTSGVWILRTSKAIPRTEYPRRPMLAVLRRQQNGVISMGLSAVYASAPILIVTAIIPASQPLYAVVEKVQRQINVGLNPFVTVLQGWVPRAQPGFLRSRIRLCLSICTAGSVLVIIVMFFGAPLLVGWLGNNQIHPPVHVYLLMAIVTGLSLFETALSKACLAAVERLGVVARATALSGIVGLAGVAVLAHFWGAGGALMGVMLGLFMRIVMELVGLKTALQDEGGDLSPSSRNQRPLPKGR
ncbi:lipopolysaccharide biosynthesis protein [Arthrobacter sp.]|uniref:lipopolysaccharide biosynthesis protein n=1 Tax=Arthrobacter sp. TaxID=1667 RepID=UPI003A8CFF2F